MNLAILFWFYKELDLCENRLRLIRRFNPHTPVYALYGGAPAEEGAARERLASWCDDFFAFPEERDADWKWTHGDQLIASWHRNRGQHLAWDTVVVVQWDTLLLGPVERIFAMLRGGEILLSGLRPVAEVEAWWGWVSGADPAKRREYLEFIDLLAVRHGWRGEPLCALFIVACLPRLFLDRYVDIERPDLGFMEYKIPTYARMFGIPTRADHPFHPWWASDAATREAPPSRKALNAVGQEVALDTVLDEWLNPVGSRVIHPFRAPFAPHLARRPLARIHRWLRQRRRARP